MEVSNTSSLKFPFFCFPHQDQEVFPLVLPYLPFGDYISLAKASNRWKNIAQDYNNEDANIIIDQETLQRYPILSNKDIYEVFDITILTLRKVEENDISEIMSCFPNVYRWRMIDMQIPNNITGLSQTLQELKLIKVDMKWSLITELLTFVGGTLLSLHLDIINQRQEDRIELDLSQICDTLTTLVMFGKDIKLKLSPTMRILKIVANKFQCNVNDCSYLMRLHLDCDTFMDYSRDNRVVNVGSMKYLESLVIKALPKTLPETLKNLRINESVDPKHKKDLEELNLDTLDVHYYDYAPEDKPNLILKTLNNDCLLYLLKYLSTKDCISFAASHSQLHQLITRHCFPVLEFKVDNVEFLKQNRDFWNDAAQWAYDLSINKIKDLSWINSDFSSLKSLGLSGLELTEAFISKLPINLESFSLIKCHIKHTDESNNPLVTYLARLNNLREIAVCTRFMDVTTLIEILKRNMDTLEHFSFTVQSRSLQLPRFESFWKVFDSLDFINHITLKDGDEWCIQDVLEMFNDGSIPKYPLIFSSIGKHLQKLTLSIRETGYKTLLNDNSFPNLQVLELFDCSELTKEEFLALRTLKRLHTITMGSPSSDSSLKDYQIVYVIQHLPELRKFTVIRFETTTLLRKFLEDHGGRLFFNSI